MLCLLGLLARAITAALRPRANLVLENLALRQQLAVLKRRQPRPRVSRTDRLFWLFLRRCWSRWADALIIAKPETVVRWHRAGFRAYWRWKIFLSNHRDVLAGMDFFTVPTVTFRVLYVFFVIHHDRRRVLHVNVTDHPTAVWITQQLREAFPFDAAPRHLILDRDSKYSADVIAFIKAAGVSPVRTSFRSPWQNGVTERWVGTCRREILDHVIVANENHLRRLLRDYLDYYHRDRCHLALAKDAPASRAVEPRPSAPAKVVALPRLGGLAHRYAWRDDHRAAA